MPQEPDNPPVTGRATRFRATEYLIPVLLVLLVAWAGWWVVQRSLTRVRERAPEAPLRLPGNGPGVGGRR